jgi:hypothetical protein
VPNVTRWVNVYGPQCAILLDAANTLNSVSVSLPVGLSFMSLPLWPLAGGVQPADPADVLGVAQNRLLLARWEPSKAGDDKYTWYPQVRPFAPGLGYFLDLQSAIVGRTIYGTVPSPASGFYAELEPGWNGIGFPYDSTGTIAVSDLMIGRGDTPVSWSQAVANGWVEGGVFDFQEGRVPETDEVTELIRLQGYWVACLVGDALQVYFPAPTPAGASTSSVTALAARRQPAEFDLPILAAAAGKASIVRLAARQGATNGYDSAFDFHQPPSLSDAPAIYCPHGNWGGNSGRFVRDTLPAGGLLAKTWDLEVVSGAGGTAVTLSWPDLSQLPSRARPVLVDRDRAWTSINMRQRSSYTYTSGGPGAVKRFRVRISGAGYVALSGWVGWRAAAGASALITLGEPARVRVVLRDAAGRMLATAAASASKAGSCSVLLPGSARLRPGRYVCEIEAVTEDGRSGRVVRTVTVPGRAR